MDIVVKINLKPIKATYESLSLFYKLGIVAILFSLLSIIIPHEAYANETPKPLPYVMVFESGDHVPFLSEIEADLEFQYRHETAVEKLQRHLRLGEAVKQYLEERRSPLAPFSAQLIQLNNWKKIVALANAESTLCKKYIESTANCWGVGGSNLWDMGENLGQGIVNMNHFLNNYPARSSLKYSQMNFEQMNGLYKQPARDHWVHNNLQVYNDLTAIEKSVLD